MASITSILAFAGVLLGQGLESIPVHWLEGRSGVAASDLRDFLYIRADSASSLGAGQSDAHRLPEYAPKPLKENR